MEWEIDEKMPRHNDINDFEVWIYGQVRQVKRIGNSSLSLTPGTLAFTDCKHPMQNVICNESDIKGWRIKAPSQNNDFQPNGELK